MPFYIDPFRFSSFRSSLLIGAATCLGIIPAWAQSPATLPAPHRAEETITLEAIEVEAAEGERADTYRAESSSIASRAPMDVRQIPMSTSTVTRRRMDDELVTTDLDAIARATGMNVGGSPHAQEISSRGFSTLSNIDGLRMEGEDSNFLPAIDAALLESIEIMRGPAGLLEGAGEPGGVVSRRLKRPFDIFRAEASASIGSDQFRRFEFDLSAPFNEAGTVRGRLAGALTDRNFFYDVADQQKAAFLGTIEADVTDATTVRMSALYQNDERIPFWGVVGHEDGYLLDIDRSTFLGSRFGNYSSEYAMISGEIAHRLENGWIAKLMGNYYNHNLSIVDMMPLYPAYPDGSRLVTDLGLNVMKNPDTGYNLDASASGNFELFGQTHKAVFGASYIASNLKVDERWGYDEFPVDIADPDPNTPIPPTADDGIRQDRDYRQYGIYGQLNYKLLNRLTLIAGGRINWARMESDITGPVIQDYEENAFATPLLGMVFDLTPSTALYASYADIFEPQFQRDRDGNAILPMTGTQYEAGIKTEIVDGKLSAHFAVFDITRENEAQRVGPWPSQIFEAVGETRSRGFEVEVTGTPVEGWKLSAGYSYTDHVVTKAGYSSFLGQIASNTPRHKFNLWTSYRFQSPLWERLEIGAGLTAASEFYDWSNDYEADGYVVVDMAANWRLTDHVDLTLKATNLFDEVYYESLGSSGTGNMFGTPRSFMLQVRGRL